MWWTLSHVSLGGQCCNIQHVSCLWGNFSPPIFQVGQCWCHHFRKHINKGRFEQLCWCQKTSWGKIFFNSRPGDS